MESSNFEDNCEFEAIKRIPYGHQQVFGQQGQVDLEGRFEIPVESQADFLNSLTEESFSQNLNTRFRVTTGLTAINLVLINVRRFEPNVANSSRTANLDSFSVVFRGPRRRHLESQTYQVSHDQMGSFELFISPVNDHTKQQLYEVVFNRLRP